MYDTQGLVQLYKGYVFSYVETGTPALYHAGPCTLAPIDALQTAFLNHVGLDAATALRDFHLAPLKTQRDIAMLGLLHKIQLGMAPECLRDLFSRQTKPIYAFGRRVGPPRHAYQLLDPVSKQSPVFFKRSIFGLAHVYNNLPADLVEVKEVKLFQLRLQLMVKEQIHSNSAWESALSPSA